MLSRVVLHGRHAGAVPCRHVQRQLCGAVTRRLLAVPGWHVQLPKRGDGTRRMHTLSVTGELHSRSGVVLAWRDRCVCMPRMGQCWQHRLPVLCMLVVGAPTGAIASNPPPIVPGLSTSKECLLCQFAAMRAVAHPCAFAGCR